MTQHRSHRNSRIVHVTAILLAVMGVGNVAQAADFDGQVLDYQAKTLYESDQNPGYTSWVGLWKLPNGTIQTNFVEAKGMLNSVDITFPVLQSTDYGQSWASATGVVPTGWSRGMAVLADGVTMIRPAASDLYLNASGHIEYPNNNFLGVEYSTDAGQTWSSPINLVSPAAYRTSLPLMIKPLRDGRVVAMAGVAETGVTPLLPNVRKVMFVGSMSEQGMTWSDEIPLMTAAEGICEESDFVELPSGDLFFMHRNQIYDAGGNSIGQNRLQSLVVKNGDTFLPQTPTTPPWNGQGFPNLLLTQEGILLDLDLTGSHWSDDYGQTWNNLMVGGQQLKTYYYPQALQADDGTIVVAGHILYDDAYGAVDESIMLQTFRLSPIQTPEPSTVGLVGSGMLCTFLYGWRVHHCAK